MGECCADKMTEEKVPKPVEVKVEEVKKEPEIPEGDETTDTAGTLGILTSACQLIPKEKRSECWQGLIPLHRGEKKASEVLEEHLYSHGMEGMEKAKKRLIWLIDKAEEKAKDRLKREGKLSPEK